MNGNYVYIGDIRFYKCIEQAMNGHKQLLKKYIGNAISIAALDETLYKSAHYVIIDLGALNQEDDIFELVKKIHECVQNMQIIVILPLKYLPGAALPAQLVQLGIYDFIRADVTNETSLDVVGDLLQDLMIHPTPYRKARRWENSALQEHEEETEIMNQKIPIVAPYKEALENEQNKAYQDGETKDCGLLNHESLGKRLSKKLKGLRDLAHRGDARLTLTKARYQGKQSIRTYNYTIAIMSTHYGAGCTTLALKLAYELAQHAKVALVELDSLKELSAFERLYDLKRGKLTSKQLGPLDIYCYESAPLIDIFQQCYEYIILDMGTLLTCKYQDEAYRSDQAILVTQMSEWKQHRLVTTLGHLKTLNQWMIASNLSNDKHYKELKKLAKVSREHVQIVKVPFMEDIFDEKSKLLMQLFKVGE